MDFQSTQDQDIKAIKTQIRALEGKLKALEVLRDREASSFAVEKVEEGWVLIAEEAIEEYGDYFPGRWMLLSPEVPPSVVEELRRYRSIDPEEEGVLEHQYIDLE